MSQENLLDPLVQQRLGNRDNFWNGLLVYSNANESIQTFGSVSLKQIVEIDSVPGLVRVETNPNVSAVSLRFRACSSQDVVVEGCRLFNDRTEDILREEDKTWQLSQALLLGAAVRNICDHVTILDIWDQLVLKQGFASKDN